MKFTWKKTGIGLMAIALLSFCINLQKVEAYDFSDESYWINVCSGYITDTNTYNACVAFKQYAKDKANSYSQSASSLQSKIDKAQGDLDALIAIGQEYQKEIAAKEAEIATIQTGIDTAQASIAEAEEDIEKKQKNIKSRKKLISKQMVDMQSDINTNQFIDFIMGATDLVDLVQRSSGVESVTKSQKEQINKLNEEKEALTLAKKEQIRIKSTLEVQQDSLEVAKASTQILKDENDALSATLSEQVEKMLAQKNAANSASNTLANMPAPSYPMNGGNADVGDLPNSGMIRPINAPISCGIGCYTGHRGADFAAPRGTPIVAPADCYVVFATNAYGDGYLGSNDGYQTGAPNGGGNSVRIMFNVNGQTYAMNFHHMTSSMPAMSYRGSGTPVARGTVLGYVGNSGNSSGAHAHVEMFTVNGSIQQAMGTWYSTGDWQSSAGWGLYTPSCGSYGCRINPANFF